MFLLKRSAPLILAGLCSCALFQQLSRSQAEPPGQAQVLAEHVQYDGEMLQFRLLVGAVDGGVVIDRRLIESIQVDSRAIHECATAAEVSFWYADWFARSPSGDELLHLKPGDWFGRDVEFLFFPREKMPDGGPECIEVSFVILPEPVAHPNWELPLIVHAERTSPDAGTALTPDSGFAPADAGP